MRGSPRFYFGLTCFLNGRHKQLFNWQSWQHWMSMSKSCAAVPVAVSGGHLLRRRAGTRTPAPGGLLGGRLPSPAQGSGGCYACQQHRCGASGVTGSIAAMWNMKGGKVERNNFLQRYSSLLPATFATEYPGQAVSQRTKMILWGECPTSSEKNLNICAES